MAHKRTLLASFDNSNCEDTYYWDDFVYDVRHQIMNRIKSTKFFCYGLNLTWRNVAGYTQFETANPAVLLDKILPQTSDFRIEFYTTEKRSIVEIVVYHHDKPMGETMWIMSQATEKRNRIKESHFNQ